jgi:glycosyltransferase involved in cell wall biosynthesis
MRIVIDLQSCQSGSRHGGIGRYSMNLLQAMVRNANAHDLHIVLSENMLTGVPEIYANLNSIPKSNIHYFPVMGHVAESTPENTFSARATELIRENFIAGLAPDIVHVTSLIEGLGDDVTTSVGRFRDDLTTAVTLYDLIPLVESEKYLTNEVSKNHYFRKLDDLKNADILLSISEYSRIEAIQELGIASDRIINISSAADTKFKPWVVPQDLANNIKQKYGISRNFLMYTGSFDQRKNHEALIKAFAALPANERKEFQLLIVGNGWNGIYEHLKWIASGVGLSEDDILFAGKVPDDDLLPLYNLCSLFVFPSLREGFGLPVLEAMSCGIPVIGSNSTSIPEVLGTSRALFDPTDVNSISKKIYEVITDANFRAYLIEHGLQQAKKFSWDESAKIAISAFESAFESRTHTHKIQSYPSSNIIQAISQLSEIKTASDRDLVSLARCVERIENNSSNSTNDLKETLSKIGLITTWGTKCGIAMYSKYLTEHDLNNYTILAASDNDTVTTDHQNILRCWKPGNDDLSNLFEVITREKIQHILIQFNYGFFDFTKLSEFVHKLVMNGKRVSITLHSTTDPIGYENKELKTLKNALALCENIFVHSKNDIANLSKLNLSENVTLFPQGIYEPTPDPFSLRITEDTFVVASYGFFLPHKGLHELINAAYLLKQEGMKINLLMLNAMYDAPISEELISSAKKLINQLGMTNEVTLITDFLNESMTIRLMQNANLVIFPYQNTGESSSAAVRMGIASGVPVAVTPLSIFDDMGKSVFKLPGTDPESLALGMKTVKNEINNKSTLAEQIHKQALKLRKDRAYSVLGRKLKNILQENFKYYGSDTRIATQVGHRIGQNLCTSGVGGCLTHGPYVSIPEGQYQILVHGAVNNDELGEARMDIACNQGSAILNESLLSLPERNDILGTLSIDLETPCTDLEVRIWVNEKSNFTISMIEIIPQYEE